METYTKKIQKRKHLEGDTEETSREVNIELHRDTWRWYTEETDNAGAHKWYTEEKLLKVLAVQLQSTGVVRNGQSFSVLLHRPSN